MLLHRFEENLCPLQKQDSNDHTGFMSVDQTFHTPSFGDDEFEIPPLSYAPTAATTRCSGQGVFGNQVPVEYLKRRLSCDHISVYLQPREESYSDCQLYSNHHQTFTHLRSADPHPQGYLTSPQGHHFSPQQHNNMQNMYQGDIGNNMQQMQYDNHNETANWQQGIQQMQMGLMAQQQQQQQLMGPPNQQQQQVFATINQQQLGNLQPMGVQSPPGSNNNSPVMESSEDSDDSTPLAQLKKQMTQEPVETTVPKVTKKPKAQKKKKKRDPNEPQKPVSAYALFFRDTQAAIKGQSPNASFGEVSKIVASMWDSLNADRKQSYRAKTEAAKKEYLKALAAYRANLVSKAAVDQSDSMYGGNPSNCSPSNSPNGSPNSRMLSMQKQSPVLTSVVDSMQPVATSHGVHPQSQQIWHMQSPPHMNNPSPPHVMLQANNGMMAMHQHQQSHMSPQQQHQQMSPQQHQQLSPQQQPHMSPQQQHQQMMQMACSSPQMCNVPGSPTYSHAMSNQVNSGSGLSNLGSPELVASLPTCLRNGCPNPAIDSPDWDREYCSSECVVSHCKDVFANWVAQRQAPPNPYSTVK